MYQNRITNLACILSHNITPFFFGTNISIVFAKMQTSRPPLSASEGKKARSIDQSKNRINHRIAPNESCFEYFLIRFLLPSWYWIPVLHDDLLLSCNMVCVQYQNRITNLACILSHKITPFFSGTNISIVFAKMQTSRPPLSASEGKKARSIDQSKKHRINHRIAPNESCFEYFLIRFLLPSWYWIPVLHDDLLLSCNMVCVQYQNRITNLACILSHKITPFFSGTNISIVFAKMQTSRPPLISRASGEKKSTID